jgi:DNA polymerase III delta prime subunit
MGKNKKNKDQIMTKILINSAKTNYFPQTLPPAQLWVGHHDHLVHETQLYAQKIFCKHNGCQTCPTCLHIRDKQHHAMLWLYPEKNYTIDQLDDLFATIALQLNPTEQFFIIIQKADFLTIACANKLLKSMEEPPPGYHFILLTERIEQLLPTIRSRCVMHTFSSTTSPYTTHQLYECFTTNTLSPFDFSKMIDTTPIGEKESIELLDTVLKYWIEKYKKNSLLTEKAKKHESIIRKIQTAFKKPPMPGSTILFWRNLYLQLHNDLIFDHH